jgi:sugar (pentulose or hexulose) kinase
LLSLNQKRYFINDPRSPLLIFISKNPVQACKDAIAQVLTDCDRSRVKGIAVSGQQHGLVVLDADKNVIRPAKLWCDLESAKEAQELSETFHTTIVPSFTSKF